VANNEEKIGKKKITVEIPLHKYLFICNIHNEGGNVSDTIRHIIRKYSKNRNEKHEIKFQDQQ
jgi:hypothetical protein